MGIVTFDTLDCGEVEVVEGLGWHPVLRGMARHANELVDNGAPLVWDLLAALAILNALPSFARSPRAERAV